MKLQINKKYYNAADEIIKIVRYSDATGCYYDEDNYSYGNNGYSHDGPSNDLVKEVNECVETIKYKIIDDDIILYFGTHTQTLSKSQAALLYIELHKFLFDSSQERNNTQDKETII